eukprot:CAMPEP_0180134026 /NCGR_PEP_ID=MMETSP0986-20121125/9894_1 /TAXON_ID=697907 /ORGANISM="non described non described, Strain CCMP2293" /LENGTH=504 /DNA_ID=CAMNT_0022074263 /DNA_START=281 /DNA_END=1791 /DNA_ORIENTATION=+
MPMRQGHGKGCPNPAYSWWFADTGPILRRLLDGPDALSNVHTSSGEEPQRQGSGKTGLVAKRSSLQGEDEPVGDDSAKGPDAWVRELLPPLEDSMSLWNAAATLSDALQDLRPTAGIEGGEVGVEAGLRKVLGRQLFVAVVFYLLQVVASVAMPLSAYGLLRWTEADDPPQWVGFALVLALGAANTLAVLAREIFQDRCNVLGTWTFNALLGLTFRKVMKLSAADAFGNPIGKVSDLLGPGADAVIGYWAALMGLTLQPIEIICLVATLVVFVRAAALAGVGVVLAALALAALGGRKVEEAGEAKNVSAERHSRLVSEAVLAMRAIKFNVWERQFEQSIKEVKEEEMRGWRTTGRWLSLVNVASNPSVDVISLAVVATLTLGLGDALTPSILASYWTLLALLHSKIFEFPENVRSVAEGRGALRRFDAFLALPEAPNVPLGAASPLHAMTGPSYHRTPATIPTTGGERQERVEPVDTPAGRPNVEDGEGVEGGMCDVDLDVPEG